MFQSEYKYYRKYIWLNCGLINENVSDHWSFQSLERKLLERIHSHLKVLKIKMVHESGKVVENRNTTILVVFARQNDVRMDKKALLGEIFLLQEQSRLVFYRWKLQHKFTAMAIGVQFHLRTLKHLKRDLAENMGNYQRQIALMYH